MDSINIKKTFEQKLVWHNCSLEEVFPEESGRYLVVNMKRNFEIIYYYKKNRIIHERDFKEMHGFKVVTVTTDDSFYCEKDGKLEKTTVLAWAELPEDIEEFMNNFVDNSSGGER